MAWGSRSFNGTSDRIDAASISAPSNLTISGWVYPTALTNSYTGVLYGRFTAGAADFSIYIKSSGLLAIYYNNNSNSYDGTGSHTLSTNTWYNLVFTLSNSTGVAGYVNGSQDKTVAAVYSSGFNGALTIGTDPVTAGRFLAGREADVGMWNVILTASEISALANGARPNTIRPANLIGWWPLDGLQSPEEDLSGFKHNGVLTGTTPAFGPPYMPMTPRWPQEVFVTAAPTFLPAWAMGKNRVIEGMVS